MGRKSNHKRANPVFDSAEQPRRWLNEVVLTVVFLAGLGLIAWSMYLTESTMVPIKVTVLAWGLTGLVMTIVLRKAFMLYFPVVFLFFQLVFNTVVFGGLVIALLLSANYYLAPVATSVVTERIVSSGITKSRRGSARPFVKINYVGIEKRIKCDRGTNLKGYHKVKLTISKGFLGYDIIRHWELATE